MLLDVAVNDPKGATETSSPFDAAEVTESDFPFVSSAARARGFRNPPLSDSGTITEELVGAKTSTKLPMQLINKKIIRILRKGHSI